MISRILLSITIGAAAGIVLAIIGFAVVTPSVAAATDGILAGLGILIVFPLYLLLYVVVFASTLLPAGILTGAASGLASVLPNRTAGTVICILAGTLCGGYFGFQFADISLENRDTVFSLVVASVSGAVCFALCGQVLHKILRNYKANEKTNSSDPKKNFLDET